MSSRPNEQHILLSKRCQQLESGRHVLLRLTLGHTRSGIRGAHLLDMLEECHGRVLRGPSELYRSSATKRSARDIRGDRETLGSILRREFCDNRSRQLRAVFSKTAVMDSNRKPGNLRVGPSPKRFVSVSTTPAHGLYHYPFLFSGLLSGLSSNWM